MPANHSVFTHVSPLTEPFDQEKLEDVGFMTCMTLSILGNYAQTGHFGGPLAYTPYNVASHLVGPKFGGLRYDYRNPKHPYTDKFMLAGGHCIPTCYALWMIQGQAMENKFKKTGDQKYFVDPHVAMLPVDALGFRRGAGAIKNLLKDNGLQNDKLFAQTKLTSNGVARGIRALPGHAESTDMTNDVNGGPSGVGISGAAGKAAFWNMIGAPIDAPKVLAFEGEFAMTEGHAQELKTQAMAMKVGKRLRVLLSDNNAGIDDSLLGGVVDAKFTGYNLVDQWTSYGWNVFQVDNGNDYAQVVASLKAMEDWDPADRRPMIIVAKTTKGYWPVPIDHQITGFPSHPYGFKMNSEYFLKLATSFEERYGVKFVGIHDGPVKVEKDRLVQFKTNMDVAMSVLNKNGIGDWLADRLVELGDAVPKEIKSHFNTSHDPFLDDRLRVANLPVDAQTFTVTNPISGESKQAKVSLFKPAGEVAGTRRAISEIVKWMNYVTENRFYSLAADLSESINLEHGGFWGHYDPETNPAATRIKAAIQEAGNAASACAMVSQSASLDKDKFSGVWAISGTYGAFTPLMYTPARVWSQQNQDSPHRTGVLHILIGHSGPETAADGRTHFGIFATQVWKLLPRQQVIHLNFWDYNDVAAGYFAAAEIAAREQKVGIICLEVARPDFPVADRSKFADHDIKAAAKGLYVIRDFDESKPKHGYVISQGSSSTVNLVSQIPALEAAGINVKIVAAISEELFDRQPEAYRHSVLPPEAYIDAMVISTGTRRMWPIRNLGPLTDDYSMTSDWDNQWLTTGLEPDIISEAHLDQKSIFTGVKRFAKDRAKRMRAQKAAFAVKKPTAPVAV